ncbi:MAG TPA: ATP synthase F0 subunit C [Bryobacteraceae bacterium]|jgi:F-type H+-transporting ATPase subunit c|nr:ATP synthase F0 subunit C [Bryobacteraceae bacterium]
MKRMMLLLMLLLLVSTFAFAQAPGATAGSAKDWANPLAAGIGMAIASGLCGLGQGKAAAGAAEGIARNPSAAGAIRAAMLLGLVLIESLALYTLVIIFIKVV